MSVKQFSSELHYGAAISIAKALLNMELITPEEYSKVDAVLIGKYNPVIRALKSQA